MKENLVAEKSFAFAIRIVKLYQYLCQEKKEFVLSKQVLRAGTSVGANIHEAVYGQSKNDFLSKLHIALKEANETDYWIQLLCAAGYISDKEMKSVSEDCVELKKLLTSIITTTKDGNC